MKRVVVLLAAASVTGSASSSRFATPERISITGSWSVSGTVSGTAFLEDYAPYGIEGAPAVYGDEGRAEFLIHIPGNIEIPDNWILDYAVLTVFGSHAGLNGGQVEVTAFREDLTVEPDRADCDGTPCAYRAADAGPIMIGGSTFFSAPFAGGYLGSSHPLSLEQVREGFDVRGEFTSYLFYLEHDEPIPGENAITRIRYDFEARLNAHAVLEAYYIPDAPDSPVPEPGTLSLVILSMVITVWANRKAHTHPQNCRPKH